MKKLLILTLTLTLVSLFATSLQAQEANKRTGDAGAISKSNGNQTLREMAAGSPKPSDAGAPQTEEIPAESQFPLELAWASVSVPSTSFVPPPLFCWDGLWCLTAADCGGGPGTLCSEDFSCICC